MRAELAYTSAQQIIEHGSHQIVDDLQQRLISETFFAMRPLETMFQSQSPFGQVQYMVRPARLVRRL